LQEIYFNEILVNTSKAGGTGRQEGRKAGGAARKVGWVNKFAAATNITNIHKTSSMHL
jgi:hypothetical protein